MNHTPGPWKATLRELRHSVTGPQGQYIADLMWRGNDKKEEQAADAKLIAAAPKLLAAAQVVLDGLEYRIEQASNAGMPVPVFEGIADLHDAIAKATGETEHGSDTAKIQP